MGSLDIAVLLRPRAEAQKGFFAALAHTFDQNDDGVLDRAEVAVMLATLKVPDDVDAFMARFDADADGKMDEAEVVRMLADGDFQDSEASMQMMHLYLSDASGNAGIASDYLMQGVSTRPPSTAKTIQIQERETGLLVQEFVPTYVWAALQLMYNFKTSRALAGLKSTSKIMHKMSQHRGKAMDNANSAEQIADFVQLHNLETDSLYRKVEDFRTFNDFFARGMDVSTARPLPEGDEASEAVIVSPADCRMMAWPTILDSTQIWVKGKNFTLENLCGAQTKVDTARYSGGAFVIARLAPQDYHRWHYPVSGRVVRVEPIDGALYTVNPIAINKDIDVFTENKRCLVEIECGGVLGNVLMVAMAATMVGSYNLFKCEADDPATDEPVALSVGDLVNKGDVAGEWRFGGSTVLLVFEHKVKLNIDRDIEQNVAVGMETLVKVRTRIGIVE